jgi:pimeloyl-ACP methyl ester carboxylesterase
MALDGVWLAHRMRAGEVPILMVHGVGPGTSGRANFGPLLDRLDPRFGLHVIDLAGFGASGRKAAQPFFDVRFWLRQIDLAIDHVVRLHGRAPLLIGNSVGGALALKTAAARADLKNVLAIGAPAGPPAPPTLRAFWTAPRDAAALEAAMRPMTAAGAAPPPALVAERLRPFICGDYGEYFSAMLADPDGCLSAAALTAAEAARVSASVTLMHGRLDRACPVAAMLGELAPLLPHADLVLLGGCGHNVIAERTADVIAAIDRLSEEE